MGGRRHGAIWLLAAGAVGLVGLVGCGVDDGESLDATFGSSTTSTEVQSAVRRTTTTTRRATTTTKPEPTTTRPPTTRPPTTPPPTPEPTAPPTPEPTPAPPPPPPPPPPAPSCDANYTGCVPIASDVDCAGGSGNGPAYVNGPVQVIGTDIYDLDSDNDGVGCES